MTTDSWLLNLDYAQAIFAYITLSNYIKHYITFHFVLFCSVKDVHVWRVACINY